MWRTLLAIAVALVAAFIVVKLISLVVSIVISVVGWLIVLALGAAVAIPVYLYVRQKLLA